MSSNIRGFKKSKHCSGASSYLIRSPRATMSISQIEPPSLDVPETRQEANETISEFQSMEISYNTICNQALETIEAFLSYPDLDEGIRKHLRLLLPKVSQKKDQILALIAQVLETLNTNVDAGDANDDDEDEEEKIDSQTIAEYEETVNEFTAMTEELNQQLVLLSKVVSVKDRVEVE
ncbi:hypothetical protein GYMLUDRAFT_399871 [Collybiopsis luxurians FD-317 M1]|nr:hypothetical protein GYMLUDRAFT_399871 [Collybiopsis luxurians FD-317 M1]